MSRRRQRNPRQLPSWVMPTIIYGGGAYLLWRLFKGIADQFGNMTDKAETAVANAIVGKSTVGVAPGITYTLPNGSRIKAELTVASGGGRFKYLGVEYRLVAADPPGSGNYKAVQA